MFADEAIDAARTVLMSAGRRRLRSAMTARGVAGCVIGWDIGGAHVKACLLVDGLAADAAQWPCRLWQGQDQLDLALHAARARWPEAFATARRCPSRSRSPRR